MTKPVIADSSALVSLASVSDRNYNQAISLSNQLVQENRQIIIPTEVFSETVNVLGRNGSHQMAYGTANQILSSNPIIPETTPKIRQEALTKFKNQPESVSYTDCIVMAFADEYETREIFGFDNAFRKNGYIRFGLDKKRTELPK